MLPEKGTLILSPDSIKALRAKDRAAAEILMEVGLIEVHWIKIGGTSQSVLSPPIKRYLCPSINCKELFFRLRSLKNHFFGIHNDRPFKCNFGDCRWSFSSKAKLERHKNSHFNIREFKCGNESCGKLFTTKFNLEQHLKLIHARSDKFLCTVKDCKAGFHNQRSLDLHLGKHENTERSYSCDHEGCNKTFITKNALSSHMRSHEHKPEDLKCSWKGCDKVFEMPCRLKEHMRTHTGEKLFHCDYPECGWSFYTASKLHRHTNNIHLQLRNFVCTVENCNKAFLRSQHLREHELTHLRKNLPKYSCPKEDCDTKFRTKKLLRTHLRKVHMNLVKKEKTKEKKKKSRTKKKSKKIPKKYFEMKNFDAGTQPQDQPPLLINGSINQLDNVTLLAGDCDVSPTENVPLNTHMPELVSSELLVAMNSIEPSNNDSLIDLTPMDTCNHSLVIIPPEETNNNETLVFNDNNVQYVFDYSSSPGKYNNEEMGNNGSARTYYTYTDVMNEKNIKKEMEGIEGVKKLHWTEAGNDDLKPIKLKSVIHSRHSEDLQNCKLSIPSDLVLGPGMNDHHSLIVQDELYTQEDLQVLLLDQNTLKNSIFEHSTINLRDLE